MRAGQSSWYIAITNPNCQRRAENELAALGYASFWPKLRRWVSHARVKVAKEYPVLGRYMFVEVPDGNFWKIRNVNGIEALITNQDGAPLSIPWQVVWGFRERYLQGEWDFVINETGLFINEQGEYEARKNRIPVGAIIRIMEGEFANMLGVIRERTRGQLKIMPQGGGKFIHTWPENVRAA
jgi:transcription antitermination factor NusG